MKDPELSPSADLIINELIQLEKDEDVLIITDDIRVNIARTLASISRAVGAETIVAQIPRISTYGNEPPNTIIPSMKEADVVIAALNTSLTHTDARRSAAKEGTKTFVLRGATEEMLIEGGINTDYRQLKKRTKAIKQKMDTADSAHITSPDGTDVRMDITKRNAFLLDGYYHDEAVNLNATVPTGEAPIAPDEGTAEGTIVFDYSMDNFGRLDTPIELTIKNGHVANVSGGDEAVELESIINEHDDNSTNLAEFAIGTNVDARLTGILAEDKKKAGTVHFAIGDNISLNGSIASDIHLDGMVTKPTVKLDGDIIINRGEILDEIYNE